MGLAHNIAVGCRLLGSSIVHGPRYGNPFRAAFLRFAASNFGKRLASSKETTLKVSGWKHPMHLRSAGSDFSVLRTILEEGEYARVLDWKLPAAPRILDLGGNVGVTARYFAQHWPDAKIISVEPDADNARLLAANCKHLVDSGQLRLVRGFVAARDGTATIDKSADAWAYTKNDAGQGEAIPCFTIDQLLADAGWDAADLMKCDIEGSEREVFENAGPWLARIPRIVIELHEPYSLQMFYDHLRAAGWEHRVIFDAERSPNPLSLIERTNSAH